MPSALSKRSIQSAVLLRIHAAKINMFFSTPNKYHTLGLIYTKRYVLPVLVTKKVFTQML